MTPEIISLVVAIVGVAGGTLVALTATRAAQRAAKQATGGARDVFALESQSVGSVARIGAHAATELVQLSKLQVELLAELNDAEREVGAVRLAEFERVTREAILKIVEEATARVVEEGRQAMAEKDTIDETHETFVAGEDLELET